MKHCLIEGLPVVYDGYVWIVKGFQHPVKGLIAYPRYDLLNHRKLYPWEIRRLVLKHVVYWDCLKQRVPIVPIDKIVLIDKPLGQTAREALMLARILVEYSGGLGVFLTGSVILGEGGDIDLVLVGRENVEVLEKLRGKALLKPPTLGILYAEWLRKHRNIPFNKYYWLKKDSLLMGVFMGKPYSLRITLYGRGWNKCLDKVYNRRFIRRAGVTVKEPITKYTTPSRYRVVMDSNEYILETYRILYSELNPGKYTVINGYIEDRRDNTYIIPDHGALLPNP